MLKSFFAGLMLVTLGLTSAPADATPSRVEDAFEASNASEGECYETKNNSRVCFQSVGRGLYTASLLNTKLSMYPATFYIDCNQKDAWEAYGVLSKNQARAFSIAFCKDRS